MLIRKRTSIHDKGCFNHEQLFHPVQCNACKICQFSSIDKLFLPGATGILTTSVQLHCLWGTICFASGTRQHSTCLYQSGSLHILFYHFKLSILSKKFLLQIQSSQCLAIVAFQLQLVWVSGRSFWSCKYNMIKSQFWFQLEKEVSIFSSVPTHPDSNRQNNDKE